MKTHPRALTAGYIFCVYTAQVLDGDFKCSACTCGQRPPHSFRIWREWALTICCSQLHCCALCRTECLVWPVWRVPANAWKTGAPKCRSPDTTASVSSVSAASCCSNRNCGACAWESHVEGTCSRGEDAYRGIHVSLLRSSGVLQVPRP